MGWVGNWIGRWVGNWLGAVGATPPLPPQSVPGCGCLEEYDVTGGTLEESHAAYGGLEEIELTSGTLEETHCGDCCQ